MKLGIIGDIHFGVKEGIDEFVEYQFNSLDYYFEELKERNIKDLVFLGDITDKRNSINFKTLTLIKERFIPQLKSFAEVYFITGNHDTYYKSTNKINSNRLLFEELENTVIIDNKPLVIDNLIFIPWINQENENLIKTELKKYTPHSFYLFGHLGIFSGKEAFLNEKLPISISELKEFKRVISGHVHNPFEIDNIIQMGSMCQITWKDWADKKRIGILDTESDEIEYIENPFKIFEVIEVDKKTNFKELKAEDYKNKFVKVILNTKRTIEFETFLSELNERALNLSVIDNTVIFDTVELDESIKVEDIKQILSEYVENKYGRSKKGKKIKEIMIELYRESQRLEEVEK